MPAPTYISADDLKSTLGLTGASGIDTDIGRAVTAASRAIDQVCDDRFYPDDDALQVRKFVPVNPGFARIDSLCEFTSLVAQESTWELDTDFYLEPTNAANDGRPWTAIRTIVRPFLFTAAEVAPGWSGFDARITVTGKWGWAAAPDEIVSATGLLAAKIFERRKAIFGVAGVGVDVGAAVRIGSYDEEFQTLVGPYKRTVLF